MLAQDANVSVSLIAPMFRETRQTQAMTSQLLICNRPSDGRSPATSRTPFMCNSHYNSQLGVSFVNELALEIANGQQTSSMAETDLIQRRLASTLNWPHYICRCICQLFESAVPLVLTRISIETTFLQTHVRSFLRSIQTLL